MNSKKYESYILSHDDVITFKKAYDSLRAASRLLDALCYDGAYSMRKKIKGLEKLYAELSEKDDTIPKYSNLFGEYCSAICSADECEQRLETAAAVYYKILKFDEALKYSIEGMEEEEE